MKTFSFFENLIRIGLVYCPRLSVTVKAHIYRDRDPDVRCHSEEEIAE